MHTPSRRFFPLDERDSNDIASVSVNYKSLNALLCEGIGF